MNNNPTAKDLIEALRATHPEERVSLRFAEFKVLRSDMPFSSAKLPDDFIGAIFLTLEDSIKLDGIRVPTTAPQLQQIADLLDCVMPTPRLLDRRSIASHQMGLAVEPTFNHRGVVAARLPLAEYNALVDDALQKVQSNENFGHGPLDGVGKSWVLTKRINPYSPRPFNYGWHSKAGWVHARALTSQALNVAQPLADAHNNDHVDPSQGTFGLFAKEVLLVREKQLDLVTMQELADHESLWVLVNHEPNVGLLRYPRVEPLEPLPWQWSGRDSERAVDPAQNLILEQQQTLKGEGFDV